MDDNKGYVHTQGKQKKAGKSGPVQRTISNPICSSYAQNLNLK